MLVTIEMQMAANRIFVAFCLAALVVSGANASSLIAYLSAPGQTSSIIAGVQTETFNDPSLLSGVLTYDSPIGVYTALGPNYLSQTVTRIPVVAADQYGGADGSDYMYVGIRESGDASSVDVVFSQQVDYFGFWWSAGDPENTITIYDHGKLVAQFTTSEIIDLLDNLSGEVIALNGDTYSSSSYYGNPNPAYLGKDSSETFGYVSLVASGFTFDEVVFGNIGPSGFENDNNSIHVGPLNIPADYGSFVKISNLAFTDPVPEPATGGLAGAIIGLGLIAGRKKIFR